MEKKVPGIIRRRFCALRWLQLCGKARDQELRLNGKTNEIRFVCCYACAEKSAHNVGQELTGEQSSYGPSGYEDVVYTSGEPNKHQG